MAEILREADFEQQRTLWSWFILLFVVLIISLSHYLTPLEQSVYHDIFRRLYYLPIFFGAAWGGKRGGLLVAGLSSILYAPHVLYQWENHNLHHAGHEGHLNKYIEIAIFFCFGLLFGSVFDRLCRAKEALKNSYEASRISSKLTALGQLSAGLAHEIRNPLAGIRSSLDVIEGECEESGREVVQEFFELARREIHRADRLITEFLDFAKPRPPQRVQVLVKSLLSSIQPLTAPEAQKLGVSIAIQCDPDLASVIGDADQLKQVLLNLSLNAIQNSSEKEGEVLLEARPSRRGGVLIEVSDNGKGVENSLKERIFDPFFTTRSQGVGLGLSISYQIIQQHGGELNLTSPGKLGGATFQFVLPK